MTYNTRPGQQDAIRVTHREIDKLPVPSQLLSKEIPQEYADEFREDFPQENGDEFPEDLQPPEGRSRD